jgi:hypothetical protein
MRIDTKALLIWLQARAREPSTYRGIVGAAMAAGITVDPEALNLWLSVGIGVISFINIFKRDIDRGG